MNTVRTVASTKAAFLANYPRPISSFYRRAVEEILIDSHLVTVSGRFAYNPFFALGLTTVYDTFMQGYVPPTETPKIFEALCRALLLKPEVIRQDAEKLMGLMQSGDRQQRLHALQLQDGAEDVGGIKGILAGIRDDKDFFYSRTFAIGLYTAFHAVAPEGDDTSETDSFKSLTANLNLPEERVEKDLELYRKTIEKVKMAQEALAEAAEAARSQLERRNAANEAKAAEATETTAPVESTSVTSESESVTSE